jgi:hypothetical protein
MCLMKMLNNNSVVPEPESSSPHSQKPANGPYPEPGESPPPPSCPIDRHFRCLGHRTKEIVSILRRPVEQGARRPTWTLRMQETGAYGSLPPRQGTAPPSTGAGGINCIGTGCWNAV